MIEHSMPKGSLIEGEYISCICMANIEISITHHDTYENKTEILKHGDTCTPLQEPLYISIVKGIWVLNYFIGYGIRLNLSRVWHILIGKSICIYVYIYILYVYSQRKHNNTKHSNLDENTKHVRIYEMMLWYSEAMGLWPMSLWDWEHNMVFRIDLTSITYSFWYIVFICGIDDGQILM